ncbi:aspartate carbamoyltransferase catalytic subunit [bacterium]|nr:aspartate carbamoyltransferase catalytic subunit [bacterium]
MALHSKHLLGLENVPKVDIQSILDAAVSFKEILERPIPKVPTLRHVTVVNLFFENSTRTRISFELAEKRLSADVVNFSASSSSVSKGETLIDTVRNLEAMKIDLVVMRHPMPGAPQLLAKHCSSKVINAGDGSHEHPTQALLDMMTIRETFGNFEDLRITIVGDISHSRVALSNIHGLQTMGAKVAVCGPPTLIPRALEKLGVKIYYDVDEAIANSDVLNVLRIQKERQEDGLFPSIREYHTLYGITRERMKNASRELVILHPGPINRGVELDGEVADGPQSVILQQVTNGVAVRMAILFLLSRGEGGRDELGS